jgi:hypothetical protein
MTTSFPLQRTFGKICWVDRTQIHCLILGLGFLDGGNTTIENLKRSSGFWRYMTAIGLWASPHFTVGESFIGVCYLLGVSK